MKNDMSFTGKGERTIEGKTYLNNKFAVGKVYWGKHEGRFVRVGRRMFEYTNGNKDNR